MESTDYHYSGRSTRNPFRYALAVWRLIRRDPETTTDEAAIVEMGFARSRLGRRFARWHEVIDALERDARTREALENRRTFGPIRLDELAGLPSGSLGRVFADHCRGRDLDPNLVYIPPTDAEGWMLNHLYQTHDIWHVVTGWGNDLAGEVGLGAFYAGQLRSPSFFGYMLALIIMNVVMRRADLDQVFAAWSEGFRAGRHAAPLFGVVWSDLWATPLEEVRARFGIVGGGIVGEGIRVAA